MAHLLIQVKLRQTAGYFQKELVKIGRKLILSAGFPYSCLFEFEADFCQMPES